MSKETEAFQTDEAEFGKDFVSHLSVVVVAFPLGFHAPQTHANPRVQFVEDFTTGEEVCSKVLSGTPNNTVELLDFAGIKIKLSASQHSDFVFDAPPALSWPEAGRTPA